MNNGPATTKMMGLVGEKDFEMIMQLYAQLKIFSEYSGCTTILAELERLHKSLYELKRRGYLTDEGETAIYGSFLQNLGVWDKPHLLCELSLRVILPQRKPGPRDQYAFDTLIFFLKEFCGKTTSRKPFWPILVDFLEEQGIKQCGKSNPEELKTRYYRCKKGLAEVLLNQAEFGDMPERLNFSDNFDFTYWVLLVCSEIYDAPKEIRAKALERLFPRVVKTCLALKAKKKK